MPHDFGRIQTADEDRAEAVALALLTEGVRLETKRSSGNYVGVTVVPATQAVPHRQHGIVIGERCHYCSKFRSPKEIIRLSGGAKMCERCYQWHHHALDVLAGAVPRGCQECHLSFDELSRRTGGDVTMNVIGPLNGIYAVVCKPCGDKIVRKRVDLYGDTQFGHEMKLKGAK